MDEDSSKTFSESDVYALLAHARRRLILRVLQDFETPMLTTELAEIIADCETDSPTTRKRQIILLSLYHTHLPKLNEATVVDYDRERGTVQPGPNFDILIGILEAQCDEYGPFSD